MQFTDRLFDYFAGYGASPGDTDLPSPMDALPPMSFIAGDGGVTDDGDPDALLWFDGLAADATDSGLGVQQSGALAVASGVGDAGVNGELLDFVSAEPLFAFDSPFLFQAGGLATHFVSAHGHAAFDPAEAVRKSLWYEDSWAAPVEAAGQAAPPGDGMLGETDLTFVDTGWFAKGGNGGGNSGGSNGGGNSGGGNGGGGNGGGGNGGGGDGTLSSYISGDPGGYNIEIIFKKAWTVDLQSAFIDSSELISDLIVGDISDVRFRGKIIDDIRIDAELKVIDGEGGILGQAGPTAIRTADNLPATAVMEFDSADADAFNAAGLWPDIVFHEMLHSVGFGSIWGLQDLLDGAGTDNPLFTGAAATFTYERDFDALDAVGVPVEQDGGAGTRDSHWDEETFDNEIMTGFIDSQNYLSEITVASLEDIGYQTVWDEDFFFA